MDTNSGRFVEEENADRWMQRLEVGETIKIKGEELRVVEISGRRVTLELKSATERMLEEGEAAERLGELRDQKRQREQAIRGTGFVGGAPKR